MKICIGQTNPQKGDIDKNIEIHKQFIQAAIEQSADIIVFPELSLTGYEPDLAKEIATTQSDKRLYTFQKLSDNHKIIIGCGIPTKIENNLFISMIIFQPNKERITYSKQNLFPSETEIFNVGNESIIIPFDIENIIAPAICYDLSDPKHSENAKQNNSNIYIASVLNSVNGIDEDIYKLSNIAKKHKMTVFMANFIGQSGGYECAGKSSIWNDSGELIEQLDNSTEGILLYNTKTKLTTKIKINCH
ncbi:carbon-nitrogen hydrolase family protein [Flavobacterium soyangense]|uniref:Carbon-nitrogen hydrolase family protein n=1 Tax=Flavobacterium soyangense TaxID=2023265 RepID=A0A930UFK3_9FLAO|nr:carbon-nitrogen hydrolase family protein [Flavobacterium soyangense]MBF2709859.1 carbon-nitrogen hydrolase family protein [Flavobacterium soyangense]